MLVPFVEFIFTHGLGPGVGRYLVRAPGEDAPLRRESTLVGPTLEPGAADVLVIRVDGARPARRRWRRRPAPVPGDHAEPDVSLYVATLVFGTRAFDGEEEARAALAGWRSDLEGAREIAAEGLAVVNRAIRAYRAAAADPYVTEVVESDPRSTRVGYATSEIVDGEMLEALELPAAGRTRISRAERLRPTGLVADVLAGRDRVLAGEDVLLRSVLDVEQERPVVAARQLALALTCLAEAPGIDRSVLGRLSAEAEDLPGRLADPATSAQAREDLSRVLTEAGDVVDRWHAR